MVPAWGSQVSEGGCCGGWHSLGPDRDHLCQNVPGKCCAWSERGREDSRAFVLTLKREEAISAGELVGSRYTCSSLQASGECRHFALQPSCARLGSLLSRCSSYEAGSNPRTGKPVKSAVGWAACSRVSQKFVRADPEYNCVVSLPGGCCVSLLRWQNTHIVSIAFQGTRAGTCVFPLSLWVTLAITVPGHCLHWQTQGQGRTPAGCSPPRRMEAASWGKNSAHHGVITNSSERTPCSPYGLLMSWRCAVFMGCSWIETFLFMGFYDADSDVKYTW